MEAWWVLWQIDSSVLEAAAAHLRPSLRPGPRNEVALVRLALSKLALKTSLRFRLSVTDLIWRASLRQCSSDSTTLGPAIMKKGCEAFNSRKSLDSYMCIRFRNSNRAIVREQERFMAAWSKPLRQVSTSISHSDCPEALYWAKFECSRRQSTPSLDTQWL